MLVGTRSSLSCCHIIPLVNCSVHISTMTQVQMIEQLESACIRFVHFSKENELRSRVFSEKMGLESGWNCHISLLDEVSRWVIHFRDFRFIVCKFPLALVHVNQTEIFAIFSFLFKDNFLVLNCFFAVGYTKSGVAHIEIRKENSSVVS